MIKTATAWSVDAKIVWSGSSDEPDQERFCYLGISGMTAGYAEDRIWLPEQAQAEAVASALRQAGWDDVVVVSNARY